MNSWVAFACAVVAQLPMLVVTNYLLPEPYMDEYFHYHQAIEIAQNPLEPKWDAKITTPSGLYYISLVLTLGATRLSVLRFTSLLFNSASFALLTRLNNNNTLLSMRTMTFPPLFFFFQLYYTDAGSLFFVLLGWYHLTKPASNVLSAIAALTVAIWFRQTNVIWMLCMGGMQFFKDVEQSNEAWKHDLGFWLHAVHKYAAYVLIPVAYVLYVKSQSSSSSMVFGDESNHQLSLHFSQLCYLALILWTCSPKVMLHRPRWTSLLMCTLLAAVFVHKFTITHQFLLADNRHFTFYLWSKFFRRHAMAKFLPVPLYGLGMANAGELLYAKLGALQALVYLIASVLSLVPLPLFEFRYFIVPYVVFSVLLGGNNNERLVLAAHFIVICTVQYVFWCWPFTWADGSVARFMW